MKDKRSMSQRVINELRSRGVSMKANDNLQEQIQELIDNGEDFHGIIPGMITGHEWLIQQVEDACEHLLEALLIDTFDDHNTNQTAHRMAKMFVTEVFAGRYSARPKVTDFPNAKCADQIQTIGPVTVRSACSHHLVPFVGQAWMGILPGDSTRVLGLSKFVRLANWIFARPQIQEEATEQLCNAIEESFGIERAPHAVGVVVRAEHLCMTWRGVKEAETKMVTSALRGQFLENGNARAEFFNLIKGQGF